MNFPHKNTKLSETDPCAEVLLLLWLLRGVKVQQQQQSGANWSPISSFGYHDITRKNRSSSALTFVSSPSKGNFFIKLMKTAEEPLDFDK